MFRVGGLVGVGSPTCLVSELLRVEYKINKRFSLKHEP